MCVLLLALTSCAAQPEGPAVSNPPAETNATFKSPDFTVTDRDGNAMTLSNLYGRPIVLNFWASWCPPCKAEMPDFEEAYHKWGDKVVFVMVNMTDGRQETVDTANQFIASAGYTFPVYFDTWGEAANAYRAYSIPATYCIDSSGAIVFSHVGMLDGAALESAISSLVG